MRRREVIKLGAGALAVSTLPVGFLAGCGARTTKVKHRGIYYSNSFKPLVVGNARSEYLGGVYQSWASESPSTIRTAIQKMEETQNILFDMRGTVEAMTRQAIVQIVEPTEEREAALLEGIRAMIDFHKWDYFFDGDDIIGIMRASMANARLLLTRDVLGSAIPEDLDAALLDAIAEKGCLPCYRTIQGMDNPEQVKGWAFDEAHSDTYDITLERWPEILGANNLRAIPTMGLGLGALALLGKDDRAEEWLDTAVSSSRKFLSFLSPDGGYFEGLSYINYAFRTLLGFFDAHQRLVGDIRWVDEFNAAGSVNFMLAMQAGETDEGVPDIVNFSDSRISVYPCIPSWIAKETGSAVAQYAAEEASEPGYFLDYLWYDSNRLAQLPPDTLKNVQLDLDWVIARSGWGPEDAVVAFRSGGPTNHEHADRNSFMYKVHGERLLTDQFGAAYDYRDEGWLLRLTKAHNAVLVGGEGHQYHNGEEGTNASKASARIVKYEANDDRVSWSSDATQAYNLVNEDVESVMRTVVFAKPELVILRDSVSMRSSDSVEVRFFPDNRDEQAALTPGDQAFTIERPGASLRGYVFGGDHSVVEGELDLPEDLGRFPFLEVVSEPATSHEIIAVLIARKSGDDSEPQVHLVKDEHGWMFDVDNISGRIDTTGEVPAVEWFE